MKTYSLPKNFNEFQKVFAIIDENNKNNEQQLDLVTLHFKTLLFNMVF